MSYLRVLSSYINSTLRDKLGYRETYSFPFLNEDKNIIYFNKDLSSHFDLKSILTSNKDLVISLKQTFKEFLLREIEERNIKEIKLLIDDKLGKRGIGIILVQESVEMIDINPYVEIFSHFETAEQIDEYCRSNKSIMKNICGKKELWRGLIKKVYPFLFKHEYNYEKLYKEYLKYKTYIIDEKTGLPMVRNPEYYRPRLPDMTYSSTPDPLPFKEVNLDTIPEIIKFLILEGIILPKYYLDYLEAIMDHLDKYNLDYVQQIINFIKGNIDKDEYSDTLVGAILVNMGKDNIKGIKTFLNLDFGPEYGYEWKINDILKYIIYEWEEHQVRIPNDIKNAVITTLPSELSKNFEDELNAIYTAIYDDDDITL